MALAAGAIGLREGTTKAETVERLAMVLEKAGERRWRPSVPPIASGGASGC